MERFPRLIKTHQYLFNNRLPSWHSVSRSVLVAASMAAMTVSGGCTSTVLKADNSQELLKITEFDNKIQVETIPPEMATGKYVRLPGPPPVAPPPAAVVAPGAVTKKTAKTKTKVSSNSKQASPVAPGSSVATTGNPVAPEKHEPAIEDSEGFIGRRPRKDPFRVGEKVVYDVSFFGVSGGDMTLETRPFVQVNGQKSYSFIGTAQSTSVFAMFYAVDDWFETFVDYNTLVPYSYALHVKETKQLRETRTVFDWTKNTAFYYDKKIDQQKQVKEENKSWEIPAYAQNVFTAPFYARAFQLRLGKKVVYHVAHENQNLVLTIEVVRKEHISTPAGEFDCLVVKPKIELNGVFKPVGDIFMWLTDDDRKFIVRIESKIKIGTIVAVAKSLEPGL